MPRRRIDRFLNEALESMASWLKANTWRGKEHECVNLFAHKFLFDKIEPGAAVECPTQVCIEGALKQPAGYKNPAARKDLVIWSKPLQTTWSTNWEPVRSPKAVMEWKVFRDRLPGRLFDRHDVEWITSYTEEQPTSFGYLVSVDFASEEPGVFWQQAKQGMLSALRHA